MVAKAERRPGVRLLARAAVFSLIKLPASSAVKKRAIDAVMARKSGDSSKYLFDLCFCVLTCAACGAAEANGEAMSLHIIGMS